MITGLIRDYCCHQGLSVGPTSVVRVGSTAKDGLGWVGMGSPPVSVSLSLFSLFLCPGGLLLVHGEVTDAEVDMFDREAVFIKEKLVRSGCWYCHANVRKGTEGKGGRIRFRPSGPPAVTPPNCLLPFPQSPNIHPIPACLPLRVDPMLDQVPNLKVVMEHITKKEAAEFVAAAPANVAASITPQVE